MNKRIFLKTILAFASIPFAAKAAKNDGKIYFDVLNPNPDLEVEWEKSEIPYRPDLEDRVNKAWADIEKLPKHRIWKLPNGSTIRFVDATKDYWKSAS